MRSVSGSDSPSFFRQTAILTVRYLEIIRNSTFKLLLMLLLPLASSFILAVTAAGDMCTTYSNTQTGFFVLVCSMVFIGIFNSIQEICKERKIVRREFSANLNLCAYILSKVLVQGAICLVQSLLVLSVFTIAVGRERFLSCGALTGKGAFLEYFLTIFLLTFASDATGLFISSLVRTPDSANIIAPLFLVLQIVFSGVLFSFDSTVMKGVSKLMISRWAIDALGTSCDILSLDRAPAGSGGLYDGGASRLLLSWLVLSAFVAVFSVLSTLTLRLVARDTR